MLLHKGTWSDPLTDASCAFGSCLSAGGEETKRGAPRGLSPASPRWPGARVEISLGKTAVRKTVSESGFRRDERLRKAGESFGGVKKEGFQRRGDGGKVNGTANSDVSLPDR